MQQIEANKPPIIADVFPYIDSIELSSSRAFGSKLLTDLHAAMPTGELWPDVIRDKIDSSVVWTHVLKLNQPTTLAMKLLQQYRRQSNHKTGIYRLHVALD
jgi:hypothetical protein